MTDITELALSLKAAAEEATPGGWCIDDYHGVIADAGLNGNYYIASCSGPDHRSNKRFIALANPANVLALVEALEKAQQDHRLHAARLISEKALLKERIAELESSVIAPGIMRCAKCSFVLTKNSINMSAGTITAGDSKSEPCPNGCGPLWPVTWREKALQARDDSEQWFEDFQTAKKRIAELERFRTAYMEWSDKTDWVQTDKRFEALKPWGKHRADILKAYIEHLESRTVTAAAADVLAERQRQVAAEGWTAERDDSYQNSELADAAACYAIHAHNQGFSTPAHWPWSPTWWKQTNPRRDLVKAGALILAEIERIDRAAGIKVEAE